MEKDMVDLIDDELTRLHEINKKILDNAPISVITIDRHGYITSANKYYLTFSKTKDYHGHNVFKSEFFIREGLEVYYKKLLTDGTPFERENCYEKNYKGQDKYLKIIAVPLKDKYGNIEGALSIASDDTKAVAYRKKLEDLNKNLNSIVEKRTYELKMLNQELERLSIYDFLTGLYSRNYFQKCMQKFREEKIFSGCVIVVDINDLKKVNDKLGHVAGDEIICQVANLLLSEFRKKDIIARIGGDEYCVILPEKDIAQANLITKRIYQKNVIANRRRDDLARVSIAIGSAYIASGGNIDAALALADKRMYRQKLKIKKLAKRDNIVMK